MTPPEFEVQRMREIDCDVAVIGAGTAGLAAYGSAVREGARALLIEAGPYGTTCARVGCMPSKLLVTAARAAHDARAADLFGVHAGPAAIDGPAVLRRVRTERDRFVAGVLEEVEQIPETSRLRGHARFVDARTLLVRDEKGSETCVGARAIVVAAGARPAIPKVLDAVAGRVLTHETVFELADLPTSLAVLGAGPLGLELAQAFARLGVRVRVLDPGTRIGGLRDAEVDRAAQALIGREVALALGAEVVEAQAVSEGVRLAWRDLRGTRHAETFARVLVAAGRPPALEGLDLARTGLALDAHGVPAFDRASGRCGASAIFLAGDVDHDRPVLHEATRQGEVAGRNAARYPEVTSPPRWVFLSMVFTDPGLALVGRAPDPEHGDRAASVDYASQGRARIMGRNEGLLRIYADREGRLVGAEMAVPDAEHLGHLLAYAVQDGLTAAQFLDRPFYHPTLEEGLRGALVDLAGS